MNLLDRVLTQRNLALWGFLAAVATVISLAILVIGLFLQRPESTETQEASRAGTAAPQPTPSAGATSPSNSTDTPTLTATTAPTASAVAPTTPSTDVESTAGVVSYLDECSGSGIGGPMTLNGREYAHAIQQWPGPRTSNEFNLSRRAARFHAVVGVRDDQPGEVRVQFELRGDDGRRLFISKVLGFGQSQPVNVSVEGELRISMHLKPISRVRGYAGWADAQVTGPTPLIC